MSAAQDGERLRDLLPAVADVGHAPSLLAAIHTLRAHPGLLDPGLDPGLAAMALRARDGGSADVADLLDRSRSMIGQCRDLVGAETPAGARARLLGLLDDALSETGEAALERWTRLVDEPALVDLPELRAVAATGAGSALLRRYEATGEASELDKAVRLLTPAAGEPEGRRPDRWHVLFEGLWQRYLRRGDPADLDDAIGALRVALEHATGEQTAPYWNNLGLLLVERQAMTGSHADLDAAVQALERAVAASSPEAAGLAECLNNLGTVLQRRYVRDGDLDDLERAISSFREAIERAGDEPAVASSTMANLGNAYRDRHAHTRDANDLATALDLLERSLSGASATERPRRLNNLAGGLEDRFTQTGAPEDIDRTIDLLDEACRATPEGSPERPGRLANLGAALRTRYLAAHAPADLKSAISLLESAVEATPTPLENVGRLRNLALALTDRYAVSARDADRDAAAAAFRASAAGIELNPEAAFAAAIDWGAWSGDHDDWSGAADAYRLAITSLERLVSRQMSAFHKAAWLRGARGLPGDAAYALARAGHASEAAVALERTRGMLAREMLALTDAPPPGWDELRRAAADAVLVFLAASRRGGVALIVEPDGATRTIVLDALQRATLIARMEEYAAAYRTHGHDGGAWYAAVDEMTRWLWDVAMGPLVEALALETHVRLIPVGLLGMLPLHAAWIADADVPTGRRYALDHALFTYAPTAQQLLHAAAGVKSEDVDELLAVEVPAPPGVPRLTCAHAEVEAAVAGFARVRVLREDDATRAAVLEAMREAQVIHFACHGSANLRNPLDSALYMAGGEPLTLRDILDIRLDGARLVALSAGETALPGADLPDEVVSLPTGLLQAGASAAIGSLWEPDEQTTALLMRQFYALWRRDGQPPARAFRAAQRMVRDAGGEAAGSHPYAHPVDWAAFVYTGI